MSEPCEQKLEYIWNHLHQDCQDAFAVMSKSDPELETVFDARQVIFDKICKNILRADREYEEKKGKEWPRLVIGSFLLVGAGFLMGKFTSYIKE